MRLTTVPPELRVPAITILPCRFVESWLFVRNPPLIVRTPVLGIASLFAGIAIVPLLSVILFALKVAFVPVFVLLIVPVLVPEPTTRFPLTDIPEVPLASMVMLLVNVKLPVVVIFPLVVLEASKVPPPVLDNVVVVILIAGLAVLVLCTTTPVAIFTLPLTVICPEVVKFWLIVAAPNVNAPVIFVQLAPVALKLPPLKLQIAFALTVVVPLMVPPFILT